VNYDITGAPPGIEFEGVAEPSIKAVKGVLNDPHSNSSWGVKTAVVNGKWSVTIETSSRAPEPFELLLFPDDGTSHPSSAPPSWQVTNLIGCDEAPNLPRCLPFDLGPPIVYVTDPLGRLILKPQNQRAEPIVRV